MIATMNSGLNSQALEIWFDMVAVTPEFWAIPEFRLLSPRKSARTVKALYERAGPVICKTLRYMSR